MRVLVSRYTNCLRVNLCALVDFKWLNIFHLNISVYAMAMCFSALASYDDVCSD